MLTELVAGAVADATERMALRSSAVVERAALDRARALDAVAALAPSGRVKIIAEVKRASPSRGTLATIPDAGVLAASYEAGGASAISVLTEGRRFDGSLADLEAVRARVGVPVLRKDFIVLPYQVVEARAAGADMVLLMASILDQAKLLELYSLVTDLGMTALVETHDADELSRAIDVGATVIGVNARDLSTFALDPNLFGTLVDHIPAGTIKVAESAVKTPDDVVRYRQAGADVVLVGEALVTGDPVDTLTQFLTAADSGRVS